MLLIIACEHWKGIKEKINLYKFKAVKVSDQVEVSDEVLGSRGKAPSGILGWSPRKFLRFGVC